ncbi:MAG: AMMECR1 domain-containing protein [Sulfurimonas sp.]|nr:AMMECR1 domain-containing protein [Sulfurimonas sp.]MDD3059488.1 AMMECR1 domain-containing protein [Sulfurimonas sp.]MDD5202635.1 AMMECR1 domain-containing protein [Sulfurimonas sp.]
MRRSVLLQLARDSIAEVLEAQRTIDRNALLETHPLLAQQIPSSVNIYLERKLRGSASSGTSTSSLLEDIIKNAKRAAFEDTNFRPLSTSEYLDCEVEIILDTPDGVISQRDPAILSTV